LAIVVLALAACTSSSSGSMAAPTGGSNATSPPPITIQPGHFAYDFAGVKATFVMDGHSATFDVHNGVGVEIGPPRVVVIDQKNQHVQGTIADAKSIPNGGNATFTVTFPDTIDQSTVGLIQISFGDVAYGLLKPA
jgi:hypothetical protein